MNIKQITVLGVVVVALLAAGALAARPAGQKAGALTSPDLPYNWLTVGGVREWRYTQAMLNASTTCSFLSPAATSSLSFATAQVSVAPTTTPVFEIGQSTSPNATTTTLGRRTFTANLIGSVISTTSVTALPDGLVAPNTYINVKQGGGGGSFVPTGQCTVGFREI